MKSIALFALVVAFAACGEGSAQTADDRVTAAMSASLASGVQPEGVVARRLTSTDESYVPRLSTFSRDGRYQLLNSGDLWVYDLETGEIRRVTNTVSERAGVGGGAWGGVLSSDGTQIAYLWFQDVKGESWNVLRTIAVEGGEARTLLDPTTRGAHYAEPLDWSPDDGSVLVGMENWNSATFSLATVSTSDGTVRTLKDEPDWRVPYGRAFYSPDGRYVAYSAIFAGASAMHDVRILSVDTRREERVLSGPSDDQVLGWSEDGRRLYVASNRAGSPSIWAVPVADGARAGDPTLIRREVHGLISGHVARGKLLYHIVAETPKLYTMGLDLETGRVLSEPVAEEGGRAVWIDHPVWSPDGQFLAYARGNDPQSIVVRAAIGNQLREFALPAGFLSVERMRWTPDSRRIVMTALGAAQASHILTLTLATGNFEVGLPNHAEHWPMSADGRMVYKSARGRVQAFDLSAGYEERVLYAVEEPGPGDCYPGSPSLSASGDRLALVSWDAEWSPEGVDACVGVMSTDGGEPTWIYRGAPGEVDAVVVAWTADGSSVLFAKDDPSRENLKELWIIAAAGGAPRRLFAFEGLWKVDAHPSGKRIAFMAGTARYELWVMEGLEEVGRE